jgi:hypothetical protein
VSITLFLAAALQAAPATPAAGDERTAFCWVAITNAAMRVRVRTGRMPDGLLGGALDYINGKVRGRYSDDEQLVAALRAGADAFGRADIDEAAAGCLRDYEQEMRRFTDLSWRAMSR